MNPEAKRSLRLWLYWEIVPHDNYFYDIIDTLILIRRL